MKDANAAATRTDAAQTGRSLAHAAEEMLRAGGDSRLRWGRTVVATLFQPIYCLRRGFSLGFEAFAMAVDSGGGITPAETFFSGASENERDLLDWSCRALHLRNYATVDPGDRTLFLNVHPEAAVRDARRGRELAELIRYYGLAPRRVCVEIVEAACGDEAALRHAVTAYRDLGLSVALDDFGVGMSSFARVDALGPDMVKIDRSVISGAARRADMVRTLAPMIERLHRAGARACVEGVENHDQALAAIEARADYVQGYFLAPPHERLDNDLNGAAILDQLLHIRPSVATAA